MGSDAPWTWVLHGDNVESGMVLALTIVLIVLLVAVRLLLPPVPGLLKMGVERWGKRSMVMLCAVALVGAVLMILISRH